MKKLKLEAGAPKDTVGKSWLETPLKEFVQQMALDRGTKESPLLRWLIIRGINSVDGYEVTET